MKLSVYFGDGVTVGPRLSADILMERFADHGVTAALLHGSEGYGLHRLLHAERLPDVSTDLPLLALAVTTTRSGSALRSTTSTPPYRRASSRSSRSGPVTAPPS